jgi:hypothetical protein
MLISHISDPFRAFMASLACKEFDSRARLL